MGVRYLIMGTTKDPAAYRSLGDEMTATVKANEPGTKRYNWFVSDDGHFVNEETFEDTAAMGAHIGAAQESGAFDRYMGLVEIEGVHVLGKVDEQAREMLAAFGARHYTKSRSI
jgi:quinol monooxygenase YgiN